jgi:hypothetical protein
MQRPMADVTAEVVGYLPVGGGSVYHQLDPRRLVNATGSPLAPGETRIFDVRALSAGAVPPEATAAALILVGFFMARIVREIDFSDVSEGLPALLTIVMMPLTWSITNGIGAGFVMYSFIQLITGRARQVHPMMWMASAAFVLYFALPSILPWVRQVLGV